MIVVVMMPVMKVDGGKKGEEERREGKKGPVKYSQRLLVTVGERSLPELRAFCSPIH